MNSGEERTNIRIASQTAAFTLTNKALSLTSLQTLQQHYCWRFSELQVTIQCEAEPKWDFLPLSSTLLPLTKLQRFIWERKKTPL